MSYTRRNQKQGYDNISVGNAAGIEKITVGATAPTDAALDNIAAGSAAGEENNAPGVAPPDELLAP